MSKIISVATALPPHRIPQDQIFRYMQGAYDMEGTVEERKLRFLYRQSGIDYRYSAVHDFLQAGEPDVLFKEGSIPTLEARMETFLRCAPPLAEEAAAKCMEKAGLPAYRITHLITVSCTGLSAPGLELMLMEQLGLAHNIQRTAVNFMGCYAAVHALKMAHAFAELSPAARVLVVCTELCTLHFQSEFEMEGATAAALFADGASAVIVAGSNAGEIPGMEVQSFYSEVQAKGKAEMAWHLSSKGFLMTLTSYIPDLLGADIAPLFEHALSEAGLTREEIKLWCVHPGGKRILEAIEKGLGLAPTDLDDSREVLRTVGNLSSATLFFVLDRLWDKALQEKGTPIFGVAFGPGLTMESFFLQSA